MCHKIGAGKGSRRYVRTVKKILKLAFRERIKMAIICILLFFLVFNSMSAWITWYTATHHDSTTTPVAIDSNELSHKTDSKISVPGMTPVSFHTIFSVGSIDDMCMKF